MHKLLIVDDDESLRRMMKIRLSDAFDVVDTGKPEEAIALVLEHRPTAILLDLMMPHFSGFELCQNLHTLSYTSRIPIFVVSGESAERYREHCKALGARDFFEKPVDFTRLLNRLTEEAGRKPLERRAHVRVRLCVAIKLCGMDPNGGKFEESTVTEDVSAQGFLCSSKSSLLNDSVVDVYMQSGQERFVGRARVVRRVDHPVLCRRYGFCFVEKTNDWVLQSK